MVKHETEQQWKARLDAEHLALGLPFSTEVYEDIPPTAEELQLDAEYAAWKEEQRLAREERMRQDREDSAQRVREAWERHKIWQAANPGRWWCKCGRMNHDGGCW